MDVWVVKYIRLGRYFSVIGVTTDLDTAKRMAGSRWFPHLIGNPAVHEAFAWQWHWNEEDRSWAFDPREGELFYIQQFQVVTA